MVVVVVAVVVVVVEQCVDQCRGEGVLAVAILVIMISESDRFSPATHLHMVQVTLYEQP